jgi:catechol 2,3-dioxygenase-like lactoylglutathione lyase family enzyme
MSVPARISLATLGVADLDRATKFYQALGWPLSKASVPGEVSFFRTAGGLLALWGVYALAKDAQVTHPGGPLPFRGTSLAINLDSREEVDAAFDTVANAGGDVVKPPAATEWGGYSGYFTDPDGHLWEIAHNPGWPIGPDERPQMP